MIKPGVDPELAAERHEQPGAFGPGGPFRLGGHAADQDVIRPGECGAEPPRTERARRHELHLADDPVEDAADAGQVLAAARHPIGDPVVHHAVFDVARVAERPVRALEFLDGIGAELAREVLAGGRVKLVLGRVRPGEVLVELLHRIREVRPPGLDAARWIRVMELSRMALRSASVRRMEISWTRRSPRGDRPCGSDPGWNVPFGTETVFGGEYSQPAARTSPSPAATSPLRISKRTIQAGSLLY